MKHYVTDSVLRSDLQDGNGYINRLELRHVMLNLGEQVTEEECDALVEEADTDGDGCIDFDEFYIMMTSAGRSVISFLIFGVSSVHRRR